jgi:hypothetical protein
VIVPLQPGRAAMAEALSLSTGPISNVLYPPVTFTRNNGEIGSRLKKPEAFF